MSLPRLFIDQPHVHETLAVDVTVTLSRDLADYHHLVNVLRLEVGEKVEIVVRDIWTVWLCEVEKVDAAGISFGVLESIEASPLPFETTLVLGFSKGDTNDKVVRQATELGIRRIVPTLFERSISRPDAKKAAGKIERLRKIAASAAQQSHRTCLPEICELQTFAMTLELVESWHPDLIAVPWEEESRTLLSDFIESTLLPEYPEVAQLTLVIGPEGGITAEEILRLHDIGAQSVSLGATILRVDTAACAAIAIAHDSLTKKCAPCVQ
ncbi:MAG: 16S rRNA (uracil(1498)-N(3))-methyltransferase [Coriobacteriia bacterium]|nr:16S rRNA (uracil(1498)-N(3))-methyltransferase [Coriobacteriia bacterium]